MGYALCTALKKAQLARRQAGPQGPPPSRVCEHQLHQVSLPWMDSAPGQGHTLAIPLRDPRLHTSDTHLKSAAGKRPQYILDAWSQPVPQTYANQPHRDRALFHKSHILLCMDKHPPPKPQDTYRWNPLNKAPLLCSQDQTSVSHPPPAILRLTGLHLPEHPLGPVSVLPPSPITAWMSLPILGPPCQSPLLQMPTPPSPRGHS